jgi:hypothetical protein
VRRLERISLALVVVALVALVPAGTRATAAGSNAVRDWNATAVNIVAADKEGPLGGLRSMAMVDAAIYDAVQAIGSPSGYRLNGNQISGIPANASPEAATASAARIILLGVAPGQRSNIDAAYTSTLAQIPDSTSKAIGVLVGTWAGSKVAAWRSHDGSTMPAPAYSQPGLPGTFQPSTSSSAIGTATSYLMPFAIQRANQFRAPAPPALTSAQYTADYNEVKSPGSKDSTMRTADQTQAAYFWFDDDYYMWNTVARTVAAQQQTTLAQDARMFAEMTSAMNDAAIAVFDSKYTYNYWRPENAIHGAATTGNKQITADSTWTPLMPTPQHPDYPSAHTTIGTAGSAVLASALGTDAMSFSFTTRTAPSSVTRSYTSFSQAAHEEGLSRIWVGYHFGSAVTQGSLLGQKVAAWTVSHFGTVVPAQ